MMMDSSEEDTGACLHVRRSDLAVIRLDGGDALDFLQRITTNDVRDVSESRMATTLLCTDKGRILDVVRVVKDEHHVLLVVSRVRKDEVIRFLRTYVIMDDVRIQDCSEAWSCIEVTGAGSVHVCADLIRNELPPFPVHAVHRGSADLRHLFVFSIEPRWEHSVLVVYPHTDEASRARMEELLTSVPEMDATEAEIRRMERGTPATDKELTVEHNPLEANLLHFISFRKGCYIGQEVIARLDSYNKVKVRLVGLRCPAPVRERGAVTIDGAEPGVITSVGHSARYGHIALAYIRTEYATQGRIVTVPVDTVGDPMECTIQELPFS
ncbi:MAG: YgfZ/GcvT domain-containing protein [Candidatus Kapaibacterium sp.]